jgi:hypothetical protein
VLVVFILGVGDSATHLHDAATPSVQEEDWAADAGMADGLGLTLLLPKCPQVEVLNTLAHELEAPDIVVGFAAQVGQTRRLSA